MFSIKSKLIHKPKNKPNISHPACWLSLTFAVEAAPLKFHKTCPLLADCVKSSLLLFQHSLSAMSYYNIQRNQTNDPINSSTHDPTANIARLDQGSLTSFASNVKTNTPELVGASKKPESSSNEGEPPKKEFYQPLEQVQPQLSIEENVKSLEKKLDDLVNIKNQDEYTLEQLNSKNLIAKKEYEKTREEEEVRRQIWRLYEIIGWQAKEIETARRDWSRAKEGRVDAEIKAIMLSKQEILSERRDKEFFEKTVRENSMGAKAAITDAQSHMSQLEALGGQVRELEKQAKMLEIQKELLMSKRQEKQVEIQVEKMQLEEYYEAVTQASANWMAEEGHLKERRRHAEEMYKAYRTRMKNDYGFRIDL